MCDAAIFNILPGNQHAFVPHVFLSSPPPLPLNHAVVVLCAFTTLSFFLPPAAVTDVLFSFAIKLRVKNIGRILA